MRLKEKSVVGLILVAIGILLLFSYSPLKIVAFSPVGLMIPFVSIAFIGLGLYLLDLIVKRQRN